MYKNLDVVKIAEETAISVIMSDRLKYLTFYEILENYIQNNSQNNILIGGEIATNMLLLNKIKNKISVNSFQCYDLYSDSNKYHAYELANLFYSPEGLGLYTNVETDEIIYKINVNGRRIAQFLPLIHIKGKDISVSLPKICSGIFTKTMLNCMGPEVRLIDTYQQLTSPNMVKNWPSLLKNEHNLRQLLLDTLRSKISQIFGGSSKQHNNNIIQHIIQHIIQYLQSSNCVFIGTRAIKYLNKETPKLYEKVQAITKYPLKEEATNIMKLLKTKGIQINYKITSPHLPTDIKLQRLTIKYKHSSGKTESIADIYNSAEYSLIPFNIAPTQEKIGTLFVLMRFCLIDIWILILIQKMGGYLTNEYVKIALNRIINEYESLSNIYKKTNKPFSENLSSYIGVYENPILYQKRQRIEKPKSRTYYYPGNTLVK